MKRVGKTGLNSDAVPGQSPGRPERRVWLSLPREAPTSGLHSQAVPTSGCSGLICESLILAPPYPTTGPTVLGCVPDESQDQVQSGLTAQGHRPYWVLGLESGFRTLVP